MKYLVTGTNGQLGFDVVRELKQRGINDIVIANRDNMDLLNEKAVKDMILNNKPDVVIHCAAYTNTELAEEDKENCFAVNVTATKWVVETCERVKAKLIYISTDYVFSGDKNGIYDINDEPNPINVYGKSKLEGEKKVLAYSKSFIVRTSWVFGINGKNFVKTMLRLAETKDKISVVSDQIGSPTYSKDLANRLVDLSLSEKYGIYHITNEGFCSWYDFAKKIFELANKDVKVNPITTEEYPQKAKRPKNSKLNKQCMINNGLELLPSWENALERYFEELV